MSIINYSHPSNIIINMISCKLSTILGARRIKVSDVCRGTGIARATLDRYYYDRVSSFDREVLNKLCEFLEVEIGELLVNEVELDLFKQLEL